ncbi:MAG: NMD3-related protein [Candidatus Paceibacterota bacterium]
MKKWEKYDIELPLEKTGKREIPKGKLGLVFCKECNSVYYKKSWHHNLRYLKKLRENLPIKFAICPACKMLKNRQFEGQIEIANIPQKISKELVNLIKSFCRRAYQRDPMDRLISIKNTKEGIIITTTENQLAVRLAKKIKQTFKKVKMKISYSSAPSDVVYVKLVFD